MSDKQSYEEAAFPVQSPRHTAFKIAFIYASISVIWILFSDQLLSIFTKNIETITRVQMLKGWFFVLATSYLIFLLLQKDIKKCRQVEEALRHSQELLLSFMDAMPTALSWADEQGNVRYSNNKFRELFGYTLEDMPTVEQWFQLAYPDQEYRQTVVSNWQIAVENAQNSGQEIAPIEVTIACKDGSTRYVAIVGTLLHDRILVVFNDLTESKQAEDALRESEKKYRQLVESTNDWVWSCDLKGKHIFSNRAVRSFLGYESDEIIGKSAFDFIHPEDRNWVQKMVQQAANQKKGWQIDTLRWRHKDGSVRHVESRAEPILDTEGNIAGFSGIDRDITERKRSEKALGESKSRYRTLFDSANDAILIMQDNMFIECNQKTLEMFGCTLEQIIGQTPYKFSPPHQPDGRDSTEKALEKITTALDGEPDVFEWQHTRLNGEVFDAEISLSLINIESEKFIQAIVRDISERKRLDKELRLMQRWVEKSVDLFFWVREDSQVLYVNQAVCHFLGYTKEEFRTMKVSDFDLGLPLEAWPDFTQKLKEQGSYYFESRLRKKDGQVFPVEITANILNFEGKVHFFAYSRDISAKVSAEERRKELENQLRQAQKMEAIGTLAGGIAHDFNNILSVIIGYTEIALEDELPEDSPAKSSLKEVFNAGLRAKDLVKQILTFSRQSEYEKQPVSLNDIVEETTTLLRAAIPSNIEIRKNFLSKAGMIFADPTQIHQIVMNLCTNAAYAMRAKGGVLDLDLSEVSVSMEDIRELSILKPGIYFKLAITDTGHGMDQLTMEQIFDPFFTTKPKEEGTGLGLSVVHGIVKDHGGQITVESEIGKGTAFNVYLPKMVSPDMMEIDEPTSIKTGTEKILIVDDEQAVVDSMVKILQKLGYQVTGMSSSKKALDTFRLYPEAFDLVITDLTMPEMTGDLLAKEIVSIRPDIPIILSTGFSHQITKGYADALGIKELLMKPILRNQLAEIVRRTLDLSDLK